jgi:hypothetical protein
MSFKKATEVGQALNAYVLPPLPDFPLPPLPPITDKAIYLNCVTHTSVYSIPKRTHDLDTDDLPAILDYEKVEFVGDAILGKWSVLSGNWCG